MEPPAPVPPSIDLTQPLDGAHFAAGADVLVSAAVGNDPNATVARVDFYVDGVLLEQVTAAPWQATWTNVPPGNHLLTAVAVDPVDGDVTASAVTVTVDPPPVGSGEITLQDGVAGYDGTRDSFISIWHQYNNYGQRGDMLQQPDRFEAFVRFAVFSDEGGPVPVGAHIESAQLSLYKYSPYDHHFGLYRALRDWEESEVTWNQARDGEPWSEPRAAGVGSDIAAAIDAEGSVDWSPGWIDFDVTAALQDMADGAPNYGWKFAGISGNRNSRT